MITHYDLFAGIGGFSYALDQVFYEQEIKHIFCEWEAFPTAILKKHWPDGTYYGDIADLVADTESKQGGRLQQPKLQPYTCTDSELTILTGGFPCQPFSHAGRRQGTSDDRYKWPEMFAVIRNVRPDWVIAENVRGLASWNDGMVLETVCSDLEAEGYEVRPYIIPACSKSAPHRRERVWIVAHTANADDRGNARELPQKNEQQASKRQEERTAEFSGAGVNTTTNTRQQLRKQGSGERVETSTSIGTASTEANQREHQYTWADDWREVALATCYDRVDDELPRRLDGATLRGKRTDTISASKHRQERLKACGNAIVPQVAMEIFKAIKQTVT